MKPRQLQHQEYGERRSLPLQRQFFGGGGAPKSPPPTPPPAPPVAAARTAPVRTLVARSMPKRGRESTSFGGVNSMGNKTILGSTYKAQ